MCVRPLKATSFLGSLFSLPRREGRGETPKRLLLRVPISRNASGAGWSKHG